MAAADTTRGRRVARNRARPSPNMSAQHGITGTWAGNTVAKTDAGASDRLLALAVSHGCWRNGHTLDHEAHVVLDVRVMQIQLQQR